MKKFIFLIFLVIVSISLNAQRYKTIRIGDSLLLNGKWIKGAQEMSLIPAQRVLYTDGDSISHESSFTYNPAMDELSCVNVATFNIYNSGSFVSVTDDLKLNGNYDIYTNWSTYTINNEFNSSNGYWRLNNYPTATPTSIDYFELRSDTFEINFNQQSYSSFFTPNSLRLQTTNLWYYDHNTNGAMYFSTSSTDTVFWLYPTTNGNTYPLLRLKGNQSYSGQSGKKLFRVDDYQGNRVFEVKGDSTYLMDIRTDGSYLITSADNYSLYVNGYTSGTKSIECTSNSNGDRVTIKDILNVTPRSSAPGTPFQGDIYFNSTNNTGYMYDGTTWQALW